MVLTTTRDVQTAGQGDAHDLTPMVADVLAKSPLKAGLVTVAVIGSTAGVTTVEFEPGVVEDLGALFERLAPRRGEYRHHLRWGDDNGSSHVRAGLLGPSVSIPFTNKALMLGTWQQIALFEFDTEPRRRQIAIQLMGE
jgi:secondary thiamine-phosphate synthase enzyme